MMATAHVMTLTIALPELVDPVPAIVNHIAVARYLAAGWALRAEGTIVKGRSATVPMLAPDNWPMCLLEGGAT